MAWWALLACVAAPDPVDDGPECDPRLLADGEVRARKVLCTDELIGGGEGRMGDFLVENARVRFVVRGPYAALYAHGEGGTLIDAARVEGPDMLAELRPVADRSVVTPVNGDGWAELRLPGLTWHLDADAEALELRGPADGDDPAPAGDGFIADALGLPGDLRTGATWLDGDAWIGLDGVVTGGEGPVRVEGLGRVAMAPEALWPDGEEVAGSSDGERVLVTDGEAPLTRLPVVNGAFAARVPAGATLRGERDGCWYAGLRAGLCGELVVQVRDGEGHPVVATVSDGQGRWVVDGGGVLAVPPGARSMEVFAGPAWSIGTLSFTGVRTEAEVQLRQEMDLTGVMLARLDLRAWPEGEIPSWEALRAAWGEGATFGVTVTRDEVPALARYSRDRIEAQAASDAGGLVWSWPWAPNGRRPAHGAVEPEGLSALDLLTASEGGTAAGRVVVATPAWVEAARAEAPPWAWAERPDAVWMDGPADLPTLLALLDDAVDVAPVGPYTWIEVTDPNLAGAEAGLVDGRTTAGNGPRLALEARTPALGGRFVEVRVASARWMGPLSLTLHTPRGAQVADVPEDGRVVFAVPGEQAWAVATVTGHQTRPPWLTDPAWAISAPLWLTPPGG